MAPLALLLAPVLAVGAVPPGAPPGAVPAGPLAEAEAAVRRGDVAGALKVLRDHAAKEARDPKGLEALSRLALRSGRWDEADEAARRLERVSPDAPASPILSADALASSGRLGEAIGRLDAFLERRAGDPRALARRAELLARAGRRGEAREIARGILEPPALAPPVPARERGIALSILGRFAEARGALAEAASPGDAVDAKMDLARLLFARHNLRDAETVIADVLKRDDRRPDAWALYARLLLDGEAYLFPGGGETKFHRAERALRRALGVNPFDPETLALFARLLVQTDRPEAASRILARALREDPTHEEALGYRLALEGTEPPPGLAPEREARARLAAGALHGLSMRPAEALAEYREARRLDPEGDGVLAAIGTALLDAGEEGEAKSVLEEAFRLDPFDARLKNRLDLGERLLDPKAFETLRGARTVVRGDRKEAWYLRTHLAPAAERIHADLSRTLGFEPAGPLIVESFASEGDFSVRTIGLDGLLGVQGVCLGRVIALPSPSKRPFAWERTLRHEMGHAFTIALSRGRVPRWLGEGVSLHLEGWTAPGMLPYLKGAVALDRVPSIRRLDEGFRRPTYAGQIPTSYAIAGAAVSRIVRDKGADALSAMLRAWGRGAGLVEALDEALGETPEAFDTALGTEIRARAFAYPLDPPGTGLDLETLLKQLEQRPEDAGLLERIARARFARDDLPGAEAAARRALSIDALRADCHFLVGVSLSRAGNAAAAREALRKALRANPLHAPSLLALGALEAREAAYPEAERLLREAIRVAPDFVQPPEGFENPYRVLASILADQGKGADAMEALSAWAARDVEAIEPRRTLAELALARREPAKAVAALDEAVLVSPFDPEVRRLRAAALERAGRAEEAGEERAILETLLKEREGK